MTDRPILFSAPMIRALLDGRKTQTRRLATSKPMQRVRSGDLLWVREAWRAPRSVDHLAPRNLSWRDDRVWHEADRDNCDQHGKQRPGMFMPRWASRLTLTVTETRTLPLIWIDRGDAMAEGCPFLNMAKGPDPRHWYADLWNSLHTKPGKRWDDNPDVIVLTFTVEHRNIDR